MIWREKNILKWNRLKILLVINMKIACTKNPWHFDNVQWNFEWKTISSHFIISFYVCALPVSIYFHQNRVQILRRKWVLKWKRRQVKRLMINFDKNFSQFAGRTWASTLRHRVTVCIASIYHIEYGYYLHISCNTSSVQSQLPNDIICMHIQKKY